MFGYTKEIWGGEGYTGMGNCFEYQITLPAKSSYLFTRDDVVSQLLNSGAHFFRRLGSQKLSFFFNFPVSLARPEKIV